MNSSEKSVRNLRRSSAMTLAVVLTVAVLGLGRARGLATAAPPDLVKDDPMDFKMPDSLRERHEAFHEEFNKATKESGKVGDAARAFEKLGAIHFAKAKNVFPSLGLLPRLAEGKVTGEMSEAVKRAETLRANLPKIRSEHRDLVAGLKKLAEAAKEDGQSDYVRFAESLTLHIQEEEEILYPTVLLIGDYVKLSLKN